MGFIENFTKLISSYGNQLKIKDKDKAIIEIAQEIAQGGGSSGDSIGDTYYPLSMDGKTITMDFFETSKNYVIKGADPDYQGNKPIIVTQDVTELVFGIFISTKSNLNHFSTIATSLSMTLDLSDVDGDDENRFVYLPYVVEDSNGKKLKFLMLSQYGHAVV